jgi:asparagine synthase (glutamine-hydrolysing)
MCGIAGFVTPINCQDQDTSIFLLTNMLSAIRHRGPDGDGIWYDKNHGVALGHRRLSVLDLSPNGSQPMVSACKRFVLVFNGEIYNHLALRSVLEQSTEAPMGGWRGHSDTETLLACFAAWGVEATLKATVGMFALALWDSVEKTLVLARDRIGEKPIFYGWQKNTFLFGSELKALKVHPAFLSEPDWAAATSFLRWNYISAPATIYRGVLKLPPGSWLRLTQEDFVKKVLPEPIAYWSLPEVALTGLTLPFQGNLNEAVDELENLLRRAVQLQSVADVPVGAFLSGGIDSSMVVAMMQSATTSKVTTFSIGMPHPKLDESRYAAAVASHLGTHHVEHIITPKETLELIPKLPEIWDEPFADSSQIPTYLVCKLAKQQVTVALSGDGGDEFFLGYPQYSLFENLWRSRHLGKLPWNSILTTLSSLDCFPPVAKNIRRAYRTVNAWRQPSVIALGQYWMDRYRAGSVPLSNSEKSLLKGLPILPDVATLSGLWDAATYLPDDILVKVDRAAMANSLETRAPLLDHRIIEFALSLPPQFKLHNGVGKKVLREALYRYVPKRIVDRPKMGFSIPLGNWLRSELRPWAEEALSHISSDGPLDKKMINQIWQEHQSKTRDNSEKLWGILTLLEFVHGY